MLKDTQKRNRRSKGMCESATDSMKGKGSNSHGISLDDLDTTVRQSSHRVLDPSEKLPLYDFQDPGRTTPVDGIAGGGRKYRGTDF